MWKKSKKKKEIISHGWGWSRWRLGPSQTFMGLREAFKTTPLTENHFAKKPLAERGGTPPPLTESPLSFSGNFFPKRAKNDVFFH